MMMNNAVIAPALSPTGTSALIEHAWVLGPAGSQLITARSNHITLHHDAGYMSEYRFRSTINA